MWLNRLEYKLGRYRMPNLIIGIIIGQVVMFVLATAMPGMVLAYAPLTRSGLFHLQLWRLLTFVFIPQSFSAINLLFELYLLYFIGTALQSAWGMFRTNVYLVCGMLAAVVACLICGWGTASYLYMSLFMAFAVLFPEQRLLLFFFIPVKVKWLGWIAGAMLLLQLIVGDLGTKVNVLLSLVNFALFFGKGAVQQVRGEIYAYKRRRQWRDANRRWNG